MAHYRNTGAGERYIAEGPDVLLIATALTSAIGKIVTSIEVGKRCPSVRDVRLVVLPAKLRAVGCHGMLLWFDVAERVLVIKIGQHTRAASSPALERYAAITLGFSDGTKVHFSDRRRFVNASIMAPADVRRSVATMGPSAMRLTHDDINRVIEVATSSERTIAEALADQNVIAGLGPRTVSEALYASYISPWRPVASVTLREWRLLLDAIHIETSRALAIGMAASVAENIPSLSWDVPAITYGMTHLCDGTPIARERCTGSWTLFWVPGVQT